MAIMIRTTIMQRLLAPQLCQLLVSHPHRLRTQQNLHHLEDGHLQPLHAALWTSAPRDGQWI